MKINLLTLEIAIRKSLPKMMKNNKSRDEIVKIFRRLHL